jgi:hypothetical protein
MNFNLEKRLLEQNNRKISEKSFNRFLYEDISENDFNLFDTTLIGLQARFMCYDPDLDEIYIPDLSQLTSISNNIYALDFVVDSFTELKSFIARKKAKGVFLFPENDLLKMVPQKGYRDYNKEYDILKGNVYNNFLQRLIQNQKIDLIENFEQFVEQFLFFLAEEDNVAITRCAFLTSTKNYVFNNGLVIEVSNQDHNNLKDYYEKYFENPNFSLLIESIKKYGFFLDKNCPWRLVANLNSQTMQRNALKRIKSRSIIPATPGEFPFGPKGPGGFVPQNSRLTFRHQFYSAYYKKAYLDETSNLQQVLLNFYSVFLASFPDVVRPYEGRHNVTKLTYPKEAMSVPIMQSLYPQEYWIRLFFKIRLLENNVSIERQEVRKVEKAISSLSKQVDNAAALRYTQSQIKRFILQE